MRSALFALAIAAAMPVSAAPVVQVDGEAMSFDQVEPPASVRALVRPDAPRKPAPATGSIGLIFEDEFFPGSRKTYTRENVDSWVLHDLPVAKCRALAALLVAEGAAAACIRK